MTFDLLLKNFNIGHNFCILRDGAFIFGMCSHYDTTIPMVPSILNIWQCISSFVFYIWPWPTFENHNIGHNAFVLRGMAFIFGIHIPHDKAFPMVP